MKKISILSLIILSILFACSSDSDNTPTPTTTVTEDKQNINNTFDSFYSCLNVLDDGDLSDFLLYSLFNNTNQEYNDSYLKMLSDKFELQHGDLIINDRFQFANRTGIYTWNSTTNSWTKTASSSEITLKFPSRENQTTIDSELTLQSYNETETSFESNTYNLPTNASLTLKRNNTTVFSLNLSNVTFQTGTNFSMPLTATITIFTAPFTHTINWTRSSSTDFKFSYTSSTPQGCGTNVELNVKLYDNDYANITSLKDDVKAVNGFISEGNLKVNYAVNVQALSAFSDPTDAQINANTNAEVLYNNIKIGDLDYRTINNKTEIYIIYSDGTSENVDIYVSDFESQVRSIFANYIN
jgi:hypothetical protein